MGQPIGVGSGGSHDHQRSARAGCGQSRQYERPGRLRYGQQAVTGAEQIGKFGLAAKQLRECGEGHRMTRSRTVLQTLLFFTVRHRRTVRKRAAGFDFAVLATGGFANATVVVFAGSGGGGGCVVEVVGAGVVVGDAVVGGAMVVGGRVVVGDEVVVVVATVAVTTGKPKSASVSRVTATASDSPTD